MEAIKAPGVPAPLEDDQRDVADVWKEALKSYKGIVGFDLSPKFDNVQAMIEFGTGEMNNFHSFRHNNKKVDKLRSLFAANIDYVQAGTKLLVNAATPAFPPAAAIGTAMTYLLTACRQVSADYDSVVVFFDDMNCFLARVVILETRMPRQKAFQNCLMDVFTSFLTVCGYAHKYIELGRFKKWITNLVGGEDTDLGSARKKMVKDLSRLQNATEFAILGNTEELKLMSNELNTNQALHTEMLEAQKHALVSIQTDTETIRSDMAKLLTAFQSQAKIGIKPPVPDVDKPASATRIRNALLRVPGDKQQYRMLKETMIKDSCGWLFNNATWDAWIKQSDARPVLAVVGKPGVGKSHLAAAMYGRLAEVAKESTSGQSCVAHFYFRELYVNLRIFLAAVITAINQVAGQNEILCEAINSQMITDEINYSLSDWKGLLNALLGPLFSKSSENHLFLVLDGLDELWDLESVSEFVNMVHESELRISIALTTRPEALDKTSFTREPVKIEVTKEDQLQDYKALAWHRINNLGHLRWFRRYVQQRIAETVEKASPNLLYAEHLLARLDAMGREGAAIKACSEVMPEDLHGIYEGMLAECERRMPLPNQLVAAQLLNWVAFSFQRLTLDEVTSLVRYFSGNDTFSLEEIPEVVSRFLDIGMSEEMSAAVDATDVGTLKSIEDIKKSSGETDEEPESFNDGELIVAFKERSMRAYFREHSGTNTAWRWRPSEANRRLLITCVGLLAPEVAGKIGPGLRKYMAWLFNHFTSIEVDKHSEDEMAEVMQAFAELLLDGDVYSQTLKEAGREYHKGNTKIVTDHVQLIGQLAEKPEVLSKLTDAAAGWWRDVAANPRRIRLGLAKGYQRQLYKSEEPEEALAAYKLLHGVLFASDMEEMLSEQGRKNFPNEDFGSPKEQEQDDSEGNEEGAKQAAEPDDNDHEEAASQGAEADNSEPNEEQANQPAQVDDGCAASEASSCLGVVGLFDDIVADANGYRSVAEVLSAYKRYGPAKATCQTSLELCKEGDSTLRFKALALRATIESRMGDHQLAHATIAECLCGLDDESIPPAVKRSGLMTKAKIEAKLKHTEASVEAYAQARHVDPTGLTPGKALVKELAPFEEGNNYESYLRTLKSWTAIERLTWMAWDYLEAGLPRHANLRHVARFMGEGEFLIDIYNEALVYLDKLNAGAPMRINLAQAYMDVTGDLQQARKTLQDVLATSSSGLRYGITEESPFMTLLKAVNIMPDLLLQLFLESSNPAVKEELYKELKGLMKTRLATDVSIYSNMFTAGRRIALVKMCLKLGPAREFQRRLQRVMKDCFGALRDSIDWNDQLTIDILGHSLTELNRAVPSATELTWYARVILSSYFSIVTPVEKGEPTDKADEDSDDEVELHRRYRKESAAAPAVDEDLMDPDTAVSDCDGGVCHPATQWTRWGDEGAYYCTTCGNSLVCKHCHDAMMGDKWKFYICGKDHSFIKLPVEGWRGIKDGVVRIDGHEPVLFTDILDKLENEVVKQAWETFWKGC